ncbi:MAG TPA: DUF423 domain-containing protein [Trueperaceae bacterium]|nr:DUF423 domain-containing protein [Trueperaceae bacterium]
MKVPAGHEPARDDPARHEPAPHDPEPPAADAGSSGPAWAGFWGAVLVGLGVAVGALGTHFLVGRIPVAREATLAAAVRYQFVSGIGLLLIAALAKSPATGRSAWFRGAAVALLLGAVLFCGSLYVLIAGGPNAMGAVAPLGGAGMIAGWTLLAVALSRR